MNEEKVFAAGVDISELLPEFLLIFFKSDLLLYIAPLFWLLKAEKVTAVQHP